MIIRSKIITDRWLDYSPGRRVEVSPILSRSQSIEGIDINRFACKANGYLSLANTDGHIFSLLQGAATLKLHGQPQALSIDAGTHLYIPPGKKAKLSFSKASCAVHAATGESRARGENLIVHNERFLRSTRFVLTPQYLSRRAFLNRDHTLLSRSGDPVAWFHTTMFDTSGLPRNHEGMEVFKMSYDYQSEVNVVYDVKGSARVRFADHPYSAAPQQTWSHWSNLDGVTTYCLNESASDSCVEHYTDEKTGRDGCRRNRHEIYIEPGGHVSLCCLFDPGPTGLETHKPGDYSSYGPVAEVLQSKAYAEFLESNAAMDEMVQALSLARAASPDTRLDDTAHWQLYQSAIATALDTEERMVCNAGVERKDIIDAWRLTALA